MRTLPWLGLALLAGCAPFNTYRPNFDLQGVDRERYERDLRACEIAAEHAGFSLGNPIAGCMVGKGYRLSHSYY